MQNNTRVSSWVSSSCGLRVRCRIHRANPKHGWLWLLQTRVDFAPPISTREQILIAFIAAALARGAIVVEAARKPQDAARV